MRSRSGRRFEAGTSRHEPGDRRRKRRRADRRPPNAGRWPTGARGAPRGSWPSPAVRPRTPGCGARPRRSTRAPAEILEANARDVAAAPGLRPERRGDRPADARTRSGSTRWPGRSREVAALPDPVGEVVASSRRPNGLEVTQVRVPLGVIFMIYESRPNVTRRRRRALRQERQRGDPPRRQGGDPLQPRPAPRPRRRARPGRPARATPSSSSPTTDRAAVGHLLAHARAASTWPSPAAARA